ncbi:hypothetical protein FIBSPDRAFT_935836 [Athelia psychrophila]|uniref:DUF6534 domain-containing protein n=1 Tax=Athelia psychrophila TaxID=1759441 RepID=A0A166D564_9AGAM|nr:hypothetical protein FIBSPDRAFT_935836 [Fibularhizoctonia sp. CBS 109695]
MQERPIDLTLGAMLLGVIVTMMLYGITCCQTIRYYKNFPEDARRTKYLVGGTWFVDSVYQALLGYTAWYYLIQGRGRNLISAEKDVHWSMIAQQIPAQIIMIVVDSFYLVRIRILDGSRKRSLALMVPLIISNVAMIVFIFESFVPVTASSTFMTWSVTIFAVTQALTNITIGGTMFSIVYFKCKPQAMPRSAMLLSMLLRHTLATGVLTSMLSILYGVTYLALPDTMIWTAVYFVQGKIYINSMLAVLNKRARYRAILDRDLSLETIHVTLP